MSVNVRLTRAMLHDGGAEDADPQIVEYKDGAGTTYVYEVLPGGALAILDLKQQQVRTEITYSADAWLTVAGKRRGDQREPDRNH